MPMAGDPMNRPWIETASAGARPIRLAASARPARGMRPLRRLSVRFRVLMALLVLVALAVGQLALNRHATASAAYLLRRAEISYRQLSVYRQLSIDTLEYVLARQGPETTGAEERQRVESSLTEIDNLTTFEVGLVHDNGGDETNLSERDRIAHIRAMIESIFAIGAAKVPGTIGAESARRIYQTALKPMLKQAVDEERDEIAGVEQAMRDLQTEMRWFGRLGILVQIVAVGLILLFVNRMMLDPLTRLVSDIRQFGRGSLGHRVDVNRHDEFGLLAQHINRMARQLERRRQSLVIANTQLEATVADRTAELLASNEELREIDESRRRFFADVSHELRTPLTAIVGEADVTLRNANSDIEECRDALASILANSTYLNRRIDDLMALARSSSGELDLDRKIVDLNIIAADAIGEIRSLARVNCVIMQFEPLDHPIIVDGDRGRLRQGLMILLDNAVKFSPPYKTVEVMLADRGSHADLTVVDQGKGIALEELPRVFERFYQTEVGRRMGGTGLGLSIARRIVEAHRGKIAADSGAAGGTAITMTFPLIQDPDA